MSTPQSIESNGEVYIPHPDAFFTTLALIAEQCFSPELRRRYEVLCLSDNPRRPIFYPDPQDQGPRISLQTIEDKEGLSRTTHVDNVEYIMAGTTIEAGAHIGPYCLIGANVKIGEGADIEAGVYLGSKVHVMAWSTLEHNVTVNDEATIGRRAIIPPGAEVGYDVTLPDYTILKPGCIATQAANPTLAYEVTSE